VFVASAFKWAGAVWESSAAVPTRIFDIDIDEPLTGFDAGPGYGDALFLIRKNGTPVGKATVPVIDGRIDDRELSRTIAAAAWYPLLGMQARDWLGADPSALGDYRGLTATVAVCTRERPDDLRRCLTALTALPDDGQELIAIDNRPATDATAKVVAEFPRVRYAREDRPGLDAARNRALREAKGDIVAFIDDDAVADAGWLRGLMRPFTSPLVQCVTGLTMPLELETPAQEMFETFAGFSHRGFQRRVFQSPEHHRLAVGMIGAGANMALRRSVTDSVGWFDEGLDAGTPSQSGGDHEYFSRILRAGHRIVYDPRALNWHRHRRTPEELRKAIYGYGVGIYAHWTRTLLVERDLGVVRRAWGWFWGDQLPEALRALVGLPTDRPRQLIFAELAGCLRGPFASLSARRHLQVES